MTKGNDVGERTCAHLADNAHARFWTRCVVVEERARKIADSPELSRAIPQQRKYYALGFPHASNNISPQLHLAMSPGYGGKSGDVPETETAEALAGPFGGPSLHEMKLALEEERAREEAKQRRSSGVVGAVRHSSHRHRHRCRPPHEVEGPDKIASRSSLGVRAKKGPRIKGTGAAGDFLDLFSCSSSRTERASDVDASRGGSKGAPAASAASTAAAAAAAAAASPEAPATVLSDVWKLDARGAGGMKASAMLAKASRQPPAVHEMAARFGSWPPAPYSARDLPQRRQQQQQQQLYCLQQELQQRHRLEKLQGGFHAHLTKWPAPAVATAR